MTTPLPDPIRGGTHPIYGIYLGGSALDDSYHLTAEANLTNFRHISQVRSPKQSNTNESALIALMDDETKTKFKGNLDLTVTTSTEYDKDGFLHAVKEKVRYYGLQTFFYLPDSAGHMVFLLNNPYDFTLEEVTTEYEGQLNKPDKVLKDGSTTDETDASILNRFKAFDVYELSDLSLSRLCVECLLLDGFRENIINRFSHLPLFDDLPGQVYLMMVLDTCLASASVDVDGANQQFNALSLSSFPGENISAFSLAALKLLKVMKTAYAMDVKTGSKLLRKVSHTQCDYFNRTIHGFLDTTRSMESKFLLKDPKLLHADPDYPTYGPVGLCSLI